MGSQSYHEMDNWEYTQTEVSVRNKFLRQTDARLSAQGVLQHLWYWLEVAATWGKVQGAF